MYDFRQELSLHCNAEYDMLGRRNPPVRIETTHYVQSEQCAAHRSKYVIFGQLLYWSTCTSWCQSKGKRRTTWHLHSCSSWCSPIPKDIPWPLPCHHEGNQIVNYFANIFHDTLVVAVVLAVISSRKICQAGWRSATWVNVLPSNKKSHIVGCSRS